MISDNATLLLFTQFVHLPHSSESIFYICLYVDIRTLYCDISAFFSATIRQRNHSVFLHTSWGQFHVDLQTSVHFAACWNCRF